MTCYYLKFPCVTLVLSLIHSLDYLFIADPLCVCVWVCVCVCVCVCLLTKELFYHENNTKKDMLFASNSRMFLQWAGPFWMISRGRSMWWDLAEFICLFWTSKTFYLIQCFWDWCFISFGAAAESALSLLF